MRPDTLILAFDTSAAHCAAALLFNDRILAAQTDAMSRGQAEHLMPMLDEMLATQGYSWSDLSAIGVGVGPGNFTGIRISVSAARGLALSLGIPAIGVSTFEVMRGAASLKDSAKQLVSVPAPRDQVYLQIFENGAETGTPMVRSIDDTLSSVKAGFGNDLLGHSAREIAGFVAEGVRGTNAELRDIPQTIARIAADKLADPDFTDAAPAPLYVRAPDAAPPRDPAPVILPDPV